MYKFIFLLLALTDAGQILAQSGTGQISGHVLDEKNQALAAATVLLLKAQDSSVVKSARSKLDGSFAALERLADADAFRSMGIVCFTGYAV
jgi:hypothetical protein